VLAGFALLLIAALTAGSRARRADSTGISATDKQQGAETNRGNPPHEEILWA
jgi:hypothetical protein